MTRILSAFKFLKRVGFAVLLLGGSLTVNAQWFTDPVNPPQNLPHTYLGGLIPDSLGGAFLHVAQPTSPFIMYVRSDGDCSTIPYPGTGLGGMGSINPGPYIVTSENVFVSSVIYDFRFEGGPHLPTHLKAINDQGVILWDVIFPDTLTDPNYMVEGLDGSIWVLVHHLGDLQLPSQISVQRISSSGVPEFGWQDIPLCPDTIANEQAKLVQADGEGGFWAIFELRVGNDRETWIQHFSANAEPLLPGNGILMFDQGIVGILAAGDTTALSFRRDVITESTRYRRSSLTGTTIWDVEHPLAPTRNDVELPDNHAGLYLYRFQLSILSHLGSNGEFNFLDMPLPYDISSSGSRYKFTSDKYGRLNFLWLNQDEGRWYLQRYDSLGTALLGPPMLVLEHSNYTSGASFIQSMICDKWGGTIIGFHAWPEGDSLETGGWRFTRIDSAGSLGVDVGPLPPAQLPEQISLSAYPNPSNSSVRLSWQHSFRENGEIKIYNSLGQEVFRDNVGAYGVNYDWLHETTHGVSVSTGIYFVSLKFASQTLSTKLTVVR